MTSRAAKPASNDSLKRDKPPKAKRLIQTVSHPFIAVPGSGYWNVAKNFWRLPAGASAWAMTASLIVATVLQLVLQYRLNFWSRDFFDAFGKRDAATLQSQSLRFLLLAGLSILTAVLLLWIRMTLQRNWRAWITRHLIDRWMRDDRFHDLRFPKGEDANPEYRIAEDVRVATEGPVNMVAGLLAALIGAITFIGILWNVGGDLAFEIAGHPLTVPKYLVIAVVIYSSLLTLATMLIGRRMVAVIEGKNRAEAQFRATASKVREAGARHPVDQDGADKHRELNTAFASVVTRWREICRQLMRTTLVSQGNTLAAPIIGWVLCAPKYLIGSMSLGEVAQAVSAFVIVQTSLNWLVDNYPTLADCFSSANRVGALLQALDEFEAKRV